MNDANGRELVPEAGKAAGSTLPAGASRPWHLLGRVVVARCLPYRVRVHHALRIPRSGPVVLVANHSSMVDGPLLFGVLRRDSVFLVKHELFHGALGWALRKLGQVPIRRGQADRAALLAAVRVLRAGGLIGVFPEGTRGDGTMASAGGGAAWLARTTGARVLPVACRGTRRPQGSGRRLVPRVDVLIGRPMKLSVGPGRTGLATATERIRAALVELVDELENPTKPPGFRDETG